MRKEKEIRGMRIGKVEIKPSFSDSKSVYIKKQNKILKGKILEVIRDFRESTRYKSYLKIY